MNLDRATPQKSNMKRRQNGNQITKNLEKEFIDEISQAGKPRRGSSKKKIPVPDGSSKANTRNGDQSDQMNPDFYTADNFSPNRRNNFGESTYDHDYTPKAADRDGGQNASFGNQDRMLTTQEFLQMDGKNPQMKNSVYKNDYDQKPL
jgi:hypothetical protein